MKAEHVKVTYNLSQRPALQSPRLTLASSVRYPPCKLLPKSPLHPSFNKISLVPIRQPCCVLRLKHRVVLPCTVPHVSQLQGY